MVRLQNYDDGMCHRERLSMLRIESRPAGSLLVFAPDDANTWLTKRCNTQVIGYLLI